MTYHHDKDIQPAQFLTENIDLLPVGRALDIAMGSGRNAIYLAGMGFRVEGIDISSEAVQNTLNSAREAGVTIQAEVVDLQGSYHIKKEYYDVIICFNYLQRSLISSIKDGLRSGGVVVYETFIIDQAQLFGKPSNPDYLLKHNELLDMFREFRCLRYREGVIGNRTALAGIVAQKV
jgi:2-polyprenyl-3-methyl-5-hydroxy-6-metoxy-1,4-benzoquinol methylase